MFMQADETELVYLCVLAKAGIAYESDLNRKGNCQSSLSEDGIITLATDIAHTGAVAD